MCIVHTGISSLISSEKKNEVCCISDYGLRTFSFTTFFLLNIVIDELCVDFDQIAESLFIK